MKILNIKDFLKSKPNTLFCKFQFQVFDNPMIFIAPCGDLDFIYTDINLLECTSCQDQAEKLRKSFKEGLSVEMDFVSTSRDGSFDERQLFAVYETKDIEKLIERLKECL